MKDQNCKDCVFYVQSEFKHTLSRCEYPIPQWLRENTTGGYIGSEEMTGKMCMTFKSRADVFAESKEWIIERHYTAEEMDADSVEIGG